MAGLKVFLYIDNFYYFFQTVNADVNTMFRKTILFTVYYFKPPSKIRPEGPEALKLKAFEGGYNSK